MFFPGFSDHNVLSIRLRYRKILQAAENYARKSHHETEGTIGQSNADLKFSNYEL